MSTVSISQEERIQQDYKNVPQYIKDDIGEAIAWAKNILTKEEGDGHMFYVYAEKNRVACSFAKPEWSGDHCGRSMQHGAEASNSNGCYRIFEWSMTKRTSGGGEAGVSIKIESMCCVKV